MYQYTLTASEYTSNANETKDSLFKALESEGIIQKGMAEKLSSQYVVIWKEKGFFGRFWDKFFKIEVSSAFEVLVLKKV